MPTFDVEKMFDQIGGDKEDLSKLFSTFTRVSTKQIEELRCAIDEGDAEHLRAAAHCFKGSLGLFAAEPATEITRQLEIHAREENFKSAKRAFAELEEECSRLKSDLAAFFNSIE